MSNRWGLVFVSWLLLAPRADAQDGASTGASVALAETAPEPPPAPAEAAPPVPPGVAELVELTARLAQSPERYQLENGLSVALDPVPGAGAIAIAVVYHVGARDQPQGYTGLAHLTEHMMFEGSLHVPAHFDVEIDALGASAFNGTTERDRTTYYETIPPSQLERALYLEADRMAYMLPALREERFGNQRAVVLRERVERVDLGGLGILPGLIAGVLYPAPHPYHELFENREDVESLRSEHVAWFVQSWYAPENATLAISGEFDRDQARALIARFFGPIQRTGAGTPETPRPPVVLLEAERRLVVEANLRRDQLLVVWPTPAWGTPEDAALDLVALELDSRITMALVDSGHARSVSVAQRSYDLASELEITIETGRGRGTQEALEVVDREVQRLRDAPLSGARARALSRILVARQLVAMAGPMYRATNLAYRIHAAPEGRWSLPWSLARWTDVDAARLHQTVQRWLPAGRRLVLSLAADREAPIEGRIAVDLTIPFEGAAP